MINIEHIVERVKSAKGFSSDKDLAAFLHLSPTDFSNRKKRETLLPMLIQWAVNENIDINRLIRGGTGEIRMAGEPQIDERKVWNVYDLRRSEVPIDWERHEPVAKLNLPDQYCHGMTLLKMSGPSMEPTISDEAIIGVKVTYFDIGFQNRFQSGGLHLIWLSGEGPIVRRVFVGTGKTTLHADNHQFPDIIFNSEDADKEGVKLLGYVRWVLQYL